MRQILLKIARRLAVCLSRFRPAAILSAKIADYSRGENNYDLETNGELNFVLRLAPSCRVFFDVGANVGDWTELALKANPAAKVFAFEPEPATYSKLAARHGRAAVCENFALGAVAEERTLFAHSESSGFNSFERRTIFSAEDLREISVRVSTLDDYCASAGVDRIDFLKLDVEGFELQVLLGGERMLGERRVSIIQFEYGGTYLDAGIRLADMFEFLAARGYAIYKIFPRGIKKIEAYSQILENFQYANYAALSSECAASALRGSGINVID